MSNLLSGMIPEIRPLARTINDLNRLQDGSEGLLRERIREAKTSYSVRRVDLREADRLILNQRPHAGDIVLARVKQIGLHQNLESAEGRRQRLWVGDEIVVAYAERYAPDQFEAVVPDDLEACHLVAGGGIAALVVTRHAGAKTATQIEPLGLLADASGVLNLRRSSLARCVAAHTPLTVAVVGSSMNAGKTTTAANLIAGLRRAGLKTGAAKITGTGAGGDRWLMLDAGANPALDFTDMGHASTAGLKPDEVERILVDLSGHLAASGVDCVVLEIADGLLQRETSALLQSPAFAINVDAVIFAAPDALSAIAGVGWLRERNLPVVAVSGLVTASPLSSREAGAQVDLPLLTIDKLSTPDVLSSILPDIADLLKRTPRVA